MRHVLESRLARTAARVIAKQRPFIVGITGSVGKTSVKRAVATVLASAFRVRSAPKNYNNEIGLPVAIIGGTAPGKSMWQWLSLLARGWWLGLVRQQTFPNILVLEYGADHPGDIAALLAIARPHIGMVTAVGPAHTQFFTNVEGVIAEKEQLVKSVPTNGVAIVNADDENTLMMRDRVRAKTLTYGFAERADVHGHDYQVTLKDGVPTGIAFRVETQGTSASVRLTGCIGTGHALAALAGIAVGFARGIGLPASATALERYIPAPSRLRLLPGIKHAILIDDSYNSSPLAVAMALEAMVSFPSRGRRFVVLGDMLELGPLTEHEHRHIGELVSSKQVDYLVCVGEASRHTARGARETGMPEDRVLEFAAAPEAGRYVQNLLKPGDLVLVKGSQGIRMEKIVVELMADPLRKEQLVCRQDEQWVEKS